MMSNPQNTFNSLPEISKSQAIENLTSYRQKIASNVVCFYSSVLGGICKHNEFLVIPIDDHMVHRGDGIFEAIRFIDKKIFLIEEHLRRLYRSAQSISLKIPANFAELQAIVQETCRQSGLTNGMIRIFVSRGSGGFSTDIRECKEAQIFVIVMPFQAPAEKLYQEGVRIIKSQFISKEGMFAQVKSCNYLLNVLVKSEAVNAGADFAITFDSKGFLSESSTENVIIMKHNRSLVRPASGNLLEGTTMNRLLETARQSGYQVDSENVDEMALRQARAVFVVGTTLDVMPVRSFEETVYENSVSENRPLKQMVLDLQKNAPIGF